MLRLQEEFDTEEGARQQKLIEHEKSQSWEVQRREREASDLRERELECKRWVERRKSREKVWEQQRKDRWLYWEKLARECGAPMVETDMCSLESGTSATAT